MSDQPQADLLRHTVRVVSAHLGHNQVEAAGVPQLIQTVYQTLSGLASGLESAPAGPQPAVPIRRSVFPDYIICLEDGAKMKMLRRYIQKRFGLTPDAYRERWGLPSDYPMVAPSYSMRRSSLAKQFGLGRKAPEREEGDAAEEPVVTKVPARRARGSRG